MHRIRRALGAALLVSSSLVTSGCLYTAVSLPLDTDLQETELGTKTGESSSQSVLWLVAWGDASTQAAAEDGALTTLLHADQRIFSVLFGLYSSRTTVVYGN